MKLYFCLFLIVLAESRRQRPSASSSTSSTTQAAVVTTTTAAANNNDDADDDDVTTLVKSYIDSGSCAEVSTGARCGDSAESYYSEFQYNGRRIVVSSGIPDHEAEHDQFFVNPNTRCERWSYMSLPLSPDQASSASATDMGVTGLAVTGGTFYNHLSSPKGDVAMYNEGTSLDSCTGHSSADGQYHYHANIVCDSAATDPDTCKQIGWMRDGVPVYGYCKDAFGSQFSSCYSLRSGYSESDVVMAAGTFSSASLDTAYEFSAGAGCNLDEANGAVHPVTGEYSYFMTETYPWVPMFYYGSGGSSDLCSAA